ncbi:hypothetical protein ACI3ET_10170 [Ornithinimicrobium sp. LYQ121]|uniref:hypothetical protein n=1 Tax=Ornithinimicrobium sp. LYQ121 TaxID=3378801 RepID=UPI003853C34F
MGSLESAARRRRAAEMQRRLTELDRWDELHGLGSVPSGYRRPPARTRGGGPGLLWLLVPALVLVAYFFPAELGAARAGVTAAARSVLGLPAVDAPTRPDGSLARPGPTPEPPPGTATSESILDRLDRVVPQIDVRQLGWQPPEGSRVLPVVDPGTVGSFAFARTQPGSDVPVGFSPCGTVPVEVNPVGAPEGYAALVQGSLERLTVASGLQLELVGETSERWSDEPREPGSPVVVSWSDAGDEPVLGGSIAGMGGPTMVSGPDGRWWNAGGQVVLDAQDLPTREAHSSVLDHELAHVLGLDHVDDPGELMSPTNTGRTAFGPGDLAGLAELGAIDCP